jgi:hypothetical protein
LAAAVTRLTRERAPSHRLGTTAAQEVRRNWRWPTAVVKVQAIYTHAATATTGA